MFLSPARDHAPDALEPREPAGTAGTVLFLDRCAPGSTAPTGRRFANPVEIVVATRLDEVTHSLDRIHRLVESGLYAAGFLAYEAGAAFEPTVPRRTLEGLPYLWFGLYDTQGSPWEGPVRSNAAPLSLNALIDRTDYANSLARIRNWITAGDTYQVNYTFPLTGDFRGDAQPLFQWLAKSQRDAAHRTYLDIGTHQIASLSPELFFRIEAGRITVRPMKGTAPRHPDPTEDSRTAEWLRSSAKECAENVMIVDLLRNDLGRIAKTGTVRVERLFEVERYQTLWTMTSTISAETAASVPEVFSALFPSGSVTGAPKIRTMQLIDALESEPRGVYCGAIGWWGPDGRAEFNVAIRTLVIDAEESRATYRVGSGITWDSKSPAEYGECLLKAAVLEPHVPAFDLLESLRLHDGEYWLLERHLDRLQTSAAYFDYPFDISSLRPALETIARANPSGLHKVRLLLSAAGAIALESAPLNQQARFRVAIARAPISSQSPYVYNKTTHRAVYESAMADFDGLDDVILVNERGHLTESTRANLAVEIAGAWFTPPRSAGLLPGTFRQELLDSGAIHERSLTADDLRRASSVRLINSVRGWIDIDLVDAPDA